MNTNNTTQPKTLSNNDLAKQIDALINLNTLILNSLQTKDGEWAAGYGLKEMDAKLAELLDYFSDQASLDDQNAPTPATTKKTESPVHYLDLINEGDHAYYKAEALCTAIIMNREDEGFYSLRHDLSHAYIASINAEVVRMKAAIRGLGELARRCCK